MLGVVALDQPVEEAPAPGRALEEQAIHRRGQPGDRQQLAQARLAALRRAVDAQHAPLAAVLAVEPGADLDRPGGRLQGRGDRPRMRLGAAVDPGDLGQRRAPQPAPGRQERHRLEEVGLAGAVGPREHDHAAREAEIGAGVGAEILQLQAGDRRGAAGCEITPSI